MRAQRRNTTVINECSWSSPSNLKSSEWTRHSPMKEPGNPVESGIKNKWVETTWMQSRLAGTESEKGGRNKWASWRNKWESDLMKGFLKFGPRMLIICKHQLDWQMRKWQSGFTLDRSLEIRTREQRSSHGICHKYSITVTCGEGQRVRPYKDSSIAVISVQADQVWESQDRGQLGSYIEIISQEQTNKQKNCWQNRN